MKIYVTTHYIALLCYAEPFVFAQGMLRDESLVPRRRSVSRLAVPTAAC